MLKRKTDEKKRASLTVRIVISLALAIVMISSSAVGALAAGLSDKLDAPVGKVNIRMNGRAVLEGEAGIIDSVTYVPLRRFCELNGAESISWDGATKTATVKKGEMRAEITDRKDYIEANGRYFYLSCPVMNIEGRLYVPVRVISMLFSLDVSWDHESRTVDLVSRQESFVSGKKYYDAEDLYWLSRIISAEASGEPLLGKIAVGNVVLNRRESRAYPDSIYGVIFDRKHGVQFSPVAIGTIYNTPTEESVIAAKICLEGFTLSSSVLYFMNPRIATSNWISKNRPLAFTIGNHDFYN